MVVTKKAETARVCQGFRGLNGSMVSDIRVLGDIGSMVDGMGGSTFFKSIDLALGITRLGTTKEEKHTTALRDAYGGLREFNRCGFGLNSTSVQALQHAWDRR